MTYSFKSPPYHFIEYLSFDTVFAYKKFLNMIVGRFDLYQIEKHNSTSLTVYFPNGFFAIKLIEKGDDIRFEFRLKSKCTKKGKEMKEQVLKVDEFVNRIVIAECDS